MAGEFASGVGLKLSGKPPGTRDLPAGQLRGEIFCQFADFRRSVDASGNGFEPLLGTIDPENDAFKNGGMRAKRLFNNFGGDFAPRDVDHIAGTAAEAHFAFIDLGQIGSLKTPALEVRLGRGPIGFADRSTLYHQSATCS